MLYEFLCLCFGLSSGPRVFTKLIKVPISLLQKLCIRIVIYLEDAILMATSQEELLIAWDKLIFLLLNLGFLINTQKLILDRPSTLEFVAVLLDSQNITLSLAQEKVGKIKTQCTELLQKSLAWVRKLRKLIGPLYFHSSSSTSPVQVFTSPENLGNDFQIFYRGTIQYQNRKG